MALAWRVIRGKIKSAGFRQNLSYEWVFSRKETLVFFLVGYYTASFAMCFLCRYYRYIHIGIQLLAGVKVRPRRDTGAKICPAKFYGADRGPENFGSAKNA